MDEDDHDRSQNYKSNNHSHPHYRQEKLDGSKEMKRKFNDIYDKKRKIDLEMDSRLLEEGKNLFTDKELSNVERNLVRIEEERLALLQKNSINASIPTPTITSNNIGINPASFQSLQSESQSFLHLARPVILPITAYKDQIIKIIHENQIVILMGETGSGKTTQLPQFLIQAGYTKNNQKIICTQPRRVAAISIASKVSKELGYPLGHEVGYSVRFEDYTSSKTILKYVTEGILLREITANPTLSSYSAVMIDEAHERTLNTDILLGLLKEIIKDNHEIRIIITSATMNVDKFSKYFNNAPILVIPGRQYPITTYYLNEDPNEDFLVTCVRSIIQVHINPRTVGDVLVFLPGQEEIETVEQMLLDLQSNDDKNEISANNSKNENKNRDGNGNDNLFLLSYCKLKMIIAPIYSAMPLELQHRVFNTTPSGCRKVVLATNIAETSITIENIVNVIDCGYSKQKIFNPRTGVESLVLRLCTRESVDQRRGRAGRTAPGKCLRLYRKETMEDEMEHSLPEILRSNLIGMILQLESMGIDNLEEFEFLDPPSEEAISYAREMLFFLGCTTKIGGITRLGKSISELPLEPTLAKVLFASIKNECSLDVLKIISMLTVTDSFFHKGCILLNGPEMEEHYNHDENNNDESNESDGKLIKNESSLFHPLGDHFTLLNLWNRWEEMEFDSDWCHEFHINIKAMRASRNVFNQLVQLAKKMGIILVSARSNVDIQKSFISGFFQNIATLDIVASASDKRSASFKGRGRMENINSSYKVSRNGMQVTIHPKSVLAKSQSPLVLYHEIIETTKVFIHRVIRIEKELIDQVVPYYKYF